MGLVRASLNFSVFVSDFCPVFFIPIKAPLTLTPRIFAKFRDVGNKYKMRVRSRVSNLGDLKNPDLRQNVIAGDITPSRIAVMTTEVGSTLRWTPSDQDSLK